MWEPVLSKSSAASGGGRWGADGLRDRERARGSSWAGSHLQNVGVSPGGLARG